MMEKNERYTGGPAAAFYHSLGGVANVTHLLDLEPPVPTAQFLLSFCHNFQQNCEKRITLSTSTAQQS